MNAKSDFVPLGRTSPGRMHHEDIGNVRREQPQISEIGTIEFPVAKQKPIDNIGRILELNKILRKDRTCKHPSILVLV